LTFVKTGWNKEKAKIVKKEKLLNYKFNKLKTLLL